MDWIDWVTAISFCVVIVLCVAIYNQNDDEEKQ